MCVCVLSVVTTLHASLRVCVCSQCSNNLTCNSTCVCAQCSNNLACKSTCVCVLSVVTTLHASLHVCVLSVVTTLHASLHVCVPPTFRQFSLGISVECHQTRLAFMFMKPIFESWTIPKTTFCFPFFLKCIHFIGVLSRENPAGNAGNFSHRKPVQRGLSSVPCSTNGIAMEKTE